MDTLKYPILSKIENPYHLRKLPNDMLISLCKELRQFLINKISLSGGHFSSGLGVIELTIAIHYVYNTPSDKLIWDTGHQSYPHKIITGRKNSIVNIRKINGLHPFPCINESKYDSFSVGHSSTSISAGLGMAIANKYDNLNKKVICVIGDGAITSGLAFEAINNAGYFKSDILIILNDNNMSISNNLGALNSHLIKLSHNILNIKNNLSLKDTNFIRKILYFFKKKTSYRFLNKNNFFENLGFDYIGPIDGHNIHNLIFNLKKIKSKSNATILHVLTKKGNGYAPAENDPINWHSVSKFNPIINTISKKSSKKYITYSEIFGNWLCEIASNDNKLIAITPAMKEGSGMSIFAKRYPKQFFDVAISEQHAVTFSAGLALSGYNPVVSIYSTFLQRAYDQIIHDIAIQKLSVLFAIDRSGIIGEDGQTHQGAFDISFLRCIPNLIIMTPSSGNEFRLMLNIGYYYNNGPVVIRYPKGLSDIEKIDSNSKKPPTYSISIGKGVILSLGKEIAILNFGILLKQARYAAKKLNATLIDMRFVKPIDEKLINKISIDHKILVTLEENVISGGAGSAVNEFIMKNKIKSSVLNIGLPDVFIKHGNQEEIRSNLGLTETSILNKIKQWISIKK